MATIRPRSITKCSRFLNVSVRVQVPTGAYNNSLRALGARYFLLEKTEQLYGVTGKASGSLEPLDGGSIPPRAIMKHVCECGHKHKMCDICKKPLQKSEGTKIGESDLCGIPCINKYLNRDGR